MAIKALLLRKKLEEMQARMAQLNTREAELTSAMDEAETEEQLRSVEELVDTFTAEQRAHQETVDALQREIDTAQEELRGLETKQPAPKPNTPPMSDERKDDAHMNKRQLRAFGSMNV